ncbi:uncharacterized protein LOC132034656 [Lycium ferocissimum]|uniref:uncharacterized protein LOC132034656 n=1 Tax=Lycium ferocissimum TaxID=112874 RepID=UPI0028154C36|nr:uncharacterized protein LOC132034656 [Lycium ferocissimum]
MKCLPTKQASWPVRKIFGVRKWFPPGEIQIALLQHCTKGKFGIKKAYQGFIPQFPKVSWKGITLGASTLRRRQFITWLAIQKRLATVDRLEKWGISVNKDCILCSSEKEETMEHLWLECSYAKHMCSALLNWIGVVHLTTNWDTKVQWLEKQVKHNRARADVLKFLFSPTIYHVWNERNNRRFRGTQQESTRKLKEVAIQLHTRGNHQQKRKHVLEDLNCYPT